MIAVTLTLLSGVGIASTGEAAPQLVISTQAEDAIGALLSPEGFDAAHVGKWRLANTSLGPNCRVEFRFEGDGGESASVILARTLQDIAWHTRSKSSCRPGEGDTRGQDWDDHADQF
jgi:hypothetical protein